MISLNKQKKLGNNLDEKKKRLRILIKAIKAITTGLEKFSLFSVHPIASFVYIKFHELYHGQAFQSGLCA